ncbi:RHS repeat protein [Candidatus Neptunochlamydia vexilliferae]|uniref:Rhs family protein n=1 Tax=Candidatus Neptunichlamydia vexilliferae TaxID=1651774 RepID=A0ABS0AZJ8_9BACT|nr:RHS repeat protein [Candidatus Neptunochlamydia vexilliferae]MBF5059555.1 hypothetical protein [Candidatus Neptunochlamydia vexilliferae]
MLKLILISTIWNYDKSFLPNNPGQLTNLLDQNKEGLEYHYEEGYLTQISHTSGQAITLEYVDGHLHSVAGPGGKTLYYEYGLEGRLQEVRDNEGTLSCYDYDDGNRLAAIYNGRGNKIFSAKYDEYHRATEQVIGENLISQAFNLRDRYASIEGVANAYEHHFDPEYRPKLIQDALGREIEFTYGKESGPQKVTTSTGLEIEYEYDSQGNLIKVIDQYEGERRFSYNSQEKISSEIDGEGNKVLYQYDPQGRLIEVYRPFLLSSIGVIDGQAVIEGDIRYLTTFEYDGDSNLLKSITYPDGQKETYCYNALGFPVQIKLPNGIIIDRKYDERNRLIEVQSQGKVVKYDYDTRDQIIKTTSGQKSSHFSYDASGNLSSLTDASDRVTEYEYDSYEKLVKTIDPLRHSSTYEYCPSGLSTITLPNGSIREIFYDEYPRPVAIR